MTLKFKHALNKYIFANNNEGELPVIFPDTMIRYTDLTYFSYIISQSCGLINKQSKVGIKIINTNCLLRGYLAHYPSLEDSYFTILTYNE